MIKDNQKHFNRLHVLLDALVILFSYVLAWGIQFRLIVPEERGRLPVQTYMSALLFVIPGIIAAYRYSLAIYVMIDHPEYSAMDCLRESKRLTMGYKGQLFLLDLSFILWLILTALPVVGYAAQVYVTPYMETSRVLYYEKICRLQDETVFV